jgi:chemotaxis signal transduction protein
MKTLDATAELAWCLFGIDTRPFAVALNAVVEIVEADEFVPLAHCTPRLLGLFAYRRDLLPVIDLSEGRPFMAEPAEGRAVIMILRGEHEAWGIRIDRSTSVVVKGTLEDRHPATAGPGGSVVIGSIRRGERTHAAIDSEATWRNLRDSIERWYRGDRDHDHDRRHPSGNHPDSSFAAIDLLTSSPLRGK